MALTWKMIGTRISLLRCHEITGKEVERKKTTGMLIMSGETEMDFAEERAVKG